MRILLDTHFLIWLVKAPASISRGEYAVMAARDGPLVVSTITIWELRVKWQSLDRRGRPKGELPPTLGLAFAEGNGFTVAPLMPADCVVTLDPLPKSNDPFDQMLLVHAQRLDARLLTRDRNLIDHPRAISA